MGNVYSVGESALLSFYPSLCRFFRNLYKSQFYSSSVLRKFSNHYNANSLESSLVITKGADQDPGQTFFCIAAGLFDPRKQTKQIRCKIKKFLIHLLVPFRRFFLGLMEGRDSFRGQIFFGKKLYINYFPGSPQTLG